MDNSLIVVDESLCRHQDVWNIFRSHRNDADGCLVEIDALRRILQSLDINYVCFDRILPHINTRQDGMINIEHMLHWLWGSVPYTAKASHEIEAVGWMEWFLGVSEVEVIRRKEEFVDDNNILRHPLTGKSWPMGKLEFPTLAELRHEVEQIVLKKNHHFEQECRLEVIDNTDIGEYQANFASKDRAMVQIASNMHCLENGSPSTPADCGHLVSGYARDCTQGPAAAFGVPAASLLRAHYAFKEDGKSPEQWGQSSDRQVNLLENICGKGNYCGECINGKAVLLGSEKPVTPDLVDEVAGKIKIGLHSDVQVVFRRGSRRHLIRVVDEPQSVDQVCSSTLCYGFANRTHNPPREQLECLVRAMLRAAYEGAYLAAIKRGREILVLTLIGGSCFGNPHHIILEELKSAHEKYSRHRSSKLSKVVLVMYDRDAKEHYQKAIEETVANHRSP